MGRELRIRIGGDRTPPQIEGLEVDEQQWRLSLETHCDLLRDVAGVEPTDELTLQELVTIRARLEGYVEREKRPAERAADRSTDQGREGSSSGLLQWLRERLRALRSLVGRGQSTDGTAQQSDEPTYSVETVQGLAAVFRAAAAARRREIAAANTESASELTRTADGAETTEADETGETNETSETVTDRSAAD